MRTQKVLPVDAMAVKVEAGMGGIYGKAAGTLLISVKNLACFHLKPWIDLLKFAGTLVQTKLESRLNIFQDKL